MEARSENKVALSVQEFCARYGICRSKAYDEMSLGRLRAKKVGSRRVILIRDAEAWADSLPDAGAGA